MIVKRELLITLNNIKEKFLTKETPSIKDDENQYLSSMRNTIENNLSSKTENAVIDKTVPQEDISNPNDGVISSLAPEVETPPLKSDLSNEKLITKNNIRGLHKVLTDRVFGQDDVITEIIDVLKVSALNIQINKDKPAGNYLFAGPSGVGKTELATSLASAIDAPILVINMGEYGLEQDITKLIGTSPGYVGYNDGGILTNFIFQNPRSVILFDEIEKAHPSADKILLSIMDKGVATDNKGVNAIFKNTIIVSTTNLGADVEYISDISQEEKRSYRMQAIKENLRPEILNRYDSIFQFAPLTHENYLKVINKFLSQIKSSILEEHNIELDFSDKLLNFIVEKSYDPALGGRPARRFIEKIIIKPLADHMISESSLVGHPKILIDLTKDGNVCFKGKRNKILGTLQDTKILVKKIEDSKFTN